MTFTFHPLASAELDEVIQYYETYERGMGMAFLEEAYSAIRRICIYPAACPAASANTRKCILNRFPYALMYQIKDGNVRIIAFAHLRRRPGYWTRRA